jgi:hypothetical protein
LPGRFRHPRLALFARFAVLFVVIGTLLASAPIAFPTLARPSRIQPAATVNQKRVLLIGDSILDQQGNHAAFLLRQLGVDAKAIGIWGSGLLTRDQYDYGVTKRTGFWLRTAAHEIATFDPDVVAVYLNHNFWPPFPRDAAGNVINDLWSADGQSMVAQQARTLISELRARGAQVLFVSPVPAGPFDGRDPAATNAIWHGYVPVLRALRVPVIDSSQPIRTPTGHRSETEVSCRGREELVRPHDDLHLTRFGASLTGTALADQVSKVIHVSLLDEGAPGDHTAALVPTPTGHGYWLVGCDGSVYHFGDAPQLDGARTGVTGHRGVVAAIATATGRGLWLVTTDGTIVPVGDATPLTFDATSRSPITGASATPDRQGIWATTDTGTVLVAGTATSFGSLQPGESSAHIVDLDATPTGQGYWLTATDGTPFAFGDALAFPAPDGPATGPLAVRSFTPTADGLGGWLARADGEVVALGDAQLLGDAVWHSPPFPQSLFIAQPGPIVAIVTAPFGTGYWVLSDNGRVVALGSAVNAGGDANLAFLTK